MALALIEVKSQLRTSSIEEVLAALCNATKLIRKYTVELKFVGLFSYEYHGGRPQRELEMLKNVVRRVPSRIINCLALGDARLIRFWNLDPLDSHHVVDRWHAYKMPRMAPRYFVYNVVRPCVHTPS